MKTLVKTGLAAVTATALLVSVGSYAGHMNKSGYSCMKHGKTGVKHCVKTYKTKQGHVVTKTKTVVPATAKVVKK